MSGETGLRKIRLTRGKHAIVDRKDFDWLSKWNWQAAKDWKVYYARRRGPKDTTVIMHREITKCPKGMVVDHINGNGLDNRRKNLRICSTKENARNRRNITKNQTGYKGVVYFGTPPKYIAKIGVMGKYHCSRTYKTAEEAAAAYNRFARKFFGKYANLNVIGRPNKRPPKKVTSESF